MDGKGKFFIFTIDKTANRYKVAINHIKIVIQLR